ncbi:hypothetical protein HZC09_05415 [Candidatus Micrarchaeota archaeon]|nr:hypothetical protein [Candidatus Micrarchaeota archaeon]
MSENAKNQINETLAQPMVKAGEGTPSTKTTFMPVDVAENVPPSLRQWTRWEYLSEYVEWWKQGVTSGVQAVVLFGLGLLTLDKFAPGALLMFALAARHQDLSWMYNFIAKKFGMSRTIMLID